jgi:hypothetical protein
VEKVAPWWRAAGEEEEERMRGGEPPVSEEPRSLSEAVEWPID